MGNKTAADNNVHHNAGQYMKFYGSKIKATWVSMLQRLGFTAPLYWLLAIRAYTRSPWGLWRQRHHLNEIGFDNGAGPPSKSISIAIYPPSQQPQNFSLIFSFYKASIKEAEIGAT